MHSYKVINQFDLKNKKVFIRTDFNVPLTDGVIADDSRIRETLPTIKYAIEQKAVVILASHMGRPKGEKNPKYSLLPVAQKLRDLLECEIIFPEECIGSGVKKLIQEAKEGSVILLENLRFHPEEEKNDPIFSEKLSELADIYINDAFGAIHRAHASIDGMLKHFKEKGIGFLVEKELQFLTKLVENPEKPFVAVLGGAKVSDKIDVIDSLMNHVSGFIIGGGMAYTFLKAQGHNIGKSLVEETKIHQAEKILQRAKIKGIEITLPCDSVLADKFEATASRKTAKVGENWDNWMALDIGPDSIKLFGEKLKTAKTIFWNGPMGVFEMYAFQTGTFEMARMISESDAISVAGGGDSAAAVNLSGHAGDFSFISTGGGASMEFLEGKTLPGLKALL
ncbi:phosphoglycerate kinase [bacterium]|nr:phosphoglycerate kinase [bacterium]